MGTGGAPVSRTFWKGFPLLFPLLALETDSRNDRREEPPGFGKIAPVLYLLFTCFQEKPVLGTIGRAERGFRENRPPCFAACFPVCRESRFSKRSAAGAPGFKTIEPRFSVSFPFSRKPSSQNHQREDRDFATFWTVFPAAEDCATAPTMGENRGSPRRPSSSHRYRVDTPIPADLAAASRDPPRQSSATTARAVGVVNFDGRPPGLRRTATIEPPNLSPPPCFPPFINVRPLIRRGRNPWSSAGLGQWLIEIAGFGFVFGLVACRDWIARYRSSQVQLEKGGQDLLVRHRLVPAVGGENCDDHALE